MARLDLRAIHRSTIAVYEAQASAWDEQRSKVFFEKQWIDRFIACLPAGGEVLDIGCGTGVPIAQYLIEKNYKVTGLDAAPAMLDIASCRFPEGNWIFMDMRRLSLPQRFDGIVGWDSFFHLDPAEQRAALGAFCQHLKPKGALLLTIGDKAGEEFGLVNGQQVYHSSLDPAEYEDISASAGFTGVTLVLRDRKCGNHSLLLTSGYRPVSG